MFVLEDGTGLITSNSYGAVADADIYFADRGNTVWVGLTTPVKETLLILATDYIDMRFGQMFKGTVLVDTQALQFPRTEFDPIPANLKKATYEYAFRANSAVLSPDIVRHPSGYQISRSFEKIGPIEERTDFAVIGSGSSLSYYNAFPSVDALLKPFLKATNGSVIRN
jgi:hypothetical protein